MVVATYKGMGALVRMGKADPSRIRTVVADGIDVFGDR